MEPPNNGHIDGGKHYFIAVEVVLIALCPLSPSPQGSPISPDSSGGHHEVLSERSVDDAVDQSSDSLVLTPSHSPRTHGT